MIGRAETGRDPGLRYRPVEDAVLRSGTRASRKNSGCNSPLRGAGATKRFIIFNHATGFHCRLTPRWKHCVATRNPFYAHH